MANPKLRSNESCASSTCTAVCEASRFDTSTRAAPNPPANLGERHEPETHLIPLLLRAAVTGEPIQIFGDDYPTPDGTCVRDYIHVGDLAEAHVAAVEYLLGNLRGRDARSDAFNAGTGSGYTVMEVLRAVEKVTGSQGALQNRAQARGRRRRIGRRFRQAPPDTRLGPEAKRSAPDRPRCLGIRVTMNE